MSRIKLGISRCLLGEQVRYDGRHKLDRFLVDTLGRYVDYVPVCPEVECGLPVPRETMQLVGDPGAPRLMTRETGRDLTGQMMKWVNRRLTVLEKEDLCGFIFKSKSPSCGMERVKIFDSSRVPAAAGSGIFSGEFMMRFPMLPVEDEERLHDPDIRENFIERIFTLDCYRRAVSGARTAGVLTVFHARHKLLLMAHSEKHCRAMGRLLAGKGNLSEIRQDYQAMLMEGLKCKATVKKHVNVLQHILGYFRKLITPDEKREITGIIGQFAHEDVPLTMPLTLFRHYARKYKVEYLESQYYLNPQPVELALKKHA